MKHFFEALTSEGKNKVLPDEFDYFGKLIGSWKINYIDNSNEKIEAIFLDSSNKK